MPFHQSRYLFVIIFAVSGFSGLIYESVWAHYLKLFLGHAAFAQTLVLAIYMGGMAIGAWLCGQFSARWKNLLTGYAIVEAVIGITALCFHEGFEAMLQFGYGTVMPWLNSPPQVSAFKWSAATLLILPQSILLGMTFPLMSAGIVRRFPAQPGATVSILYFSNSAGAAIGVLVSGFILVDWIGLPGTIRTAGALNIFLALIVWFLIRRQDPEPAFPEFSSGLDIPKNSQNTALFLLVAFVTGLASFIYEIGWIRMLSLVLGSSTHAFELMLSAFISGLALGGLWIRKRIDHISRPVLFLGAVQLIMGLFALSTLILYEQSFDVMRWFQVSIEKNDTGYALFNLISHGIALAIMLPTTFFAGMTLPLITHILIKRHFGEKAIGHVYATNTLGAICGIFFAIHVGLPSLGLAGLVTLGAGIDLLAGVLLVWLAYESRVHRIPLAAAGIAVTALLLVINFVTPDPWKMASGVYRHGRFYDPDTTSLLFHKDGKTASIDLTRFDQTHDVQISTNGKPDAVINMSPNMPASPDEATMILAAAIPLSLSPRSLTAASIGMGSGLTTHTLLTSNTITSVDTIEIESAIVEAAQGFRPRVELAYSDPRSHIYIDDAKTYFSTHNKHYDIIVSEPSNPWVSGTASLFTTEFYRLIKQYMTEDGLLVQWLQLYEINLELVASVIKALSGEFVDYRIYATDDEDIIIIAFNRERTSTLSSRPFASPALARELYRVGTRHVQDMQLHYIGNKQALTPLFERYNITANSDYYPVLDQHAVKSRFLQHNASELVKLPQAPLPLTALLGDETARTETTKITPTRFLKTSDHAYAATLVRDFLLQDRIDRQYYKIDQDIRRQAEGVKRQLINCGNKAAGSGETTILNDLTGLAGSIGQYLSVHELDLIWRRMSGTGCADELPAVTQTLRLLISINHRDFDTVATIATTLLTNAHKIQPEVLPEHQEYLFLAAMLGHIKQNRHAQALELWERYSGKIYQTRDPGLHVRLLHAHGSIKENH